MRALATCLLSLTLSSAAAGQGAFWPKDWKDTAAPVEQSVAFALYTTHAETLKLTAQLYPLADGVDRDVVLSVRPHEARDAAWREVGRVQVDETDYGWPQEGVKR
ncbi:MAG: hypothetical protein VXY92_00150, partial [Planctomycetota bacterium]|nr:hypothetical protein [Planctomycetota bacterium]